MDESKLIDASMLLDPTKFWLHCRLFLFSDGDTAFIVLNMFFQFCSWRHK